MAAAGHEWVPTSLEGVLTRRLAYHGDERGAFAELWRETATPPASGRRFVQANLSRSSAGTLRGMHVHRRQHDLWSLTDGRVFVALADLRGGEGHPPLATIDAQAGTVVLIPPFVAHGFLCLEPSVMVYLVSEEYDGSDEVGFRWDDPEARIPWPAVDAPTLSQRDRTAPSLAELRSELDRTAGHPGQSSGT